MTDTLLPCPFCGHGPTVYGQETPHSPAWKLIRVCCSCGASGPNFATTKDAIAAWNRRAPALRWRSEPPDVPGLWLRHEQHTWRPCLVVCDDVASANWRSPDYIQWSHDRNWRWLGPLPEPEEREK